MSSRWPESAYALEDLRRLRYFVAVAEEASFTRAARRLLVSQPAVSEAVGQLERALRVELFARDERPVALTPAGRTLLQDAQSLLAAAERATVRVRRVAAGCEGDVVIASTQSLSAGFIPALVRRLEEHVPAFRPRHQLSWMSEVVDSVRSGRAAIGFGRYAPGVPGLRQTTLGVEPIVACLSDDHPHAHRTSIGLRDLADERWAIMDRAMAPRWYEVFMASCSAAAVEPDVAEFVAAADFTAAQATWRRVAAGRLVTYAGASLIPFITRFGIRCVPMDASLPGLPVDVIWNDGDPVATTVLDVAVDVCSADWWRGERDPAEAQRGSAVS